ncbi:MAG: tetratricopeptide repeat protein [Planctomycetes bacterium]|nr:tetratricopeptide repeat protein [Planctomycetota bacterium]
MTRVVEVPEGRSPYDRVPDALMADFRAARERFVRGDHAPARAGFERLLVRAPDVMPFGVWWQESEAWLSDPQTLRRRSEERAVLAPGVVSELLAARAQTDSAAAEAWLARAEARDPDCVWVHHARAFLALRDGRIDEARLALERALASDPGHLPARRLEVRILVRDGATEAARMRLSGWLERAASDPRVLPGEVAEARLDAALLALATDDIGRAEHELDLLDPEQVEAWRLAALRACVARERGDVAGARRYVDAARAQAPREILPAVQEALLFDEGGRDPFRARAAWVVVRELAAGSDDLAGAFETLRARVRLERIDRQAAAAERAGAAR